MEIFLSWSGDRSGACANALKAWLPCVLQYLQPWVSSHDIAKGDRGALEIAKKLDEFNFGIVCLTSDNLHSDWILFECGALSKRLESSAVYTFPLDLKPSDVRPPLGQFQHTGIEKPDVLKLLQSINAKHVSPLAESVLTPTFEKFWPDLEKALAAVPSASQVLSDVRPDREILEEILTTVRDTRTAKSGSVVTSLKTKSGIINGFLQGYFSGSDTSDTVKRIQVVGSEIVATLSVGDQSVDIKISADLTWAETKSLLLEELESRDIPF
jgi:hypothetical protein